MMNGKRALDTQSMRAARNPNSEPIAASRQKDLVRQIVVISATVFMIIAACVGAGVLGGTPV